MDHEVEIPQTTRRGLAIAAGVLGVVTVIGVVALRSTGDIRKGADRLNQASEVFEAKILSSDTAPCTGTTEADDIACETFRLRLNQGPDKGETIELEFPESPTTPDLDPGDRVVLSYNRSAEPGFEYQFADRQRRPVLLWLAVLFAVAVVALGRWRGLAALVGLGATVVVLLQFILPAILDGKSPVLVAVFGASAIAYLALYLAHGFRSMTTVALLGTLAALAVTVVLASIFSALADFTGLASEEAVLVQIGAENLDLSGLVLGGMVIGALGALDDMTVTQASAVWELRAANPGFKRRDLSRSAMRIGRDHVASTVNTLALAYAGAALPVLILFVQSRQSLGAVANSETVAVEIVRTLVGSIGLVASVPLTTWLAARVVTAEPPRRGRGRPPGNEPPSRPSGERAPAGGVTPPAASEPVEEDLPPEQQFWGRRRGRSEEPPPVPPENSG
ncbi:MAG TPA: YibE/F family protein [Acidimicrobiia bacterium]|nr:YibE/F family protein [Acidimicrobiia bacterium]